LKKANAVLFATEGTLNEVVAADISAFYSQSLLNANENYYYLAINTKNCGQLLKKRLYEVA